MKAKIFFLVLALSLTAAACNKTSDNSATDIKPANNMTVPKNHEIKMMGSGFEPSELVIRKGDTVKFVNASNQAIRPASGPHPTHTDYAEFDPKKGIEAHTFWEFKFEKSGTWKFHDHLNPAIRGTIKAE